MYYFTLVLKPTNTARNAGKVAMSTHQVKGHVLIVQQEVHVLTLQAVSIKDILENMETWLGWDNFIIKIKINHNLINFTQYLTNLASKV